MFLSIAGGYKYSYSSMLVLFYALGMIIDFFVLVYCRFDLSWSRWTSTVEMEGGKQLIIFLMSSPGHKIKFPLSLLGGNFLGIY